MTRRTALALLLAAATLAAAAHAVTPAPARACSAQPSGYTVFVPESGTVTLPLEGVLVLRSQDLGAMELPTVLVRDESGDPVPGTVEDRVVQGLTPHPESIGFHIASSTHLMVWRADEPLEPGASYAIEIEDTFQTHLLDATASAEPFAGLGALAEVELTATERRRISEGFRQSCTDPDPMVPGACPDCRFTDLIEVTAIQAALPETHDDPTTIHRLVADEAPTAVDRDAGMWQAYAPGWPARPSGSLYFPDLADAYCFHIEAESLIDGSVLAGETTCIPEAEITPLPEDPPVDDPPVDDPIVGDPGSSGGCSTTGTTTATPVALALLAFGALTIRRRN